MTPYIYADHLQLPRADVVIVGAGLFGRIIGDWLAHCGRRVQWIDREEPLAGSPPAACLMRPSWMNSMSRAEQAAALAVLDKLYGVRDLTAKLPVGSATVHWVPPAAILGAGGERKDDRPDYLSASVRAVRHGALGPVYLLEGGAWGRATTLVVAAGAWARELISPEDCPPLEYLSAQAGVAFTWPTDAPPALHIRPRAPYKQLVSFMRAPGELWCGDGTAVKPSSMTLDRHRAMRERCARFVDRDPAEAQSLSGYRPYIKGFSSAPCLLAEAQPGIWVANGGAKNGTAAAGWAAYELAHRLGGR